MTLWTIPEVASVGMTPLSSFLSFFLSSFLSFFLPSFPLTLPSPTPSLLLSLYSSLSSLSSLLSAGMTLKAATANNDIPVINLGRYARMQGKEGKEGKGKDLVDPTKTRIVQVIEKGFK